MIMHVADASYSSIVSWAYIDMAYVYETAK